MPDEITVTREQFKKTMVDVIQDEGLSKLFKTEPMLLIVATTVGFKIEEYLFKKEEAENE